MTMAHFFLWTMTPIKWSKIGFLTQNSVKKCTRWCGGKILRNSYASIHFCNYTYSGDCCGPWEFHWSFGLSIQLRNSSIWSTLKQYQNVFFGASWVFFICNDRYLLSQWTMKENMLLFIFAALSRIYFHLFLVYKEAWRSCPRVSYSFDRSRSNNYIHSQPQKWKYTIFNNVNIIYILSGKSPILKYFVN